MSSYCQDFIREKLVHDIHYNNSTIFSSHGNRFFFPHYCTWKEHHSYTPHVHQPISVQLVAVHLVDSHYCSDPGKFISVLLTSLSTMVQVELPHVNILSKVDLMEQYGKLGEVCCHLLTHLVQYILYPRLSFLSVSWHYTSLLPRLVLCSDPTLREVGLVMFGRFLGLH